MIDLLACGLDKQLRLLTPEVSESVRFDETETTERMPFRIRFGVVQERPTRLKDSKKPNT